jgi:cytoskeletal protein CcmA (bactofilin family)
MERAKNIAVSAVLTAFIGFCPVQAADQNLRGQVRIDGAVQGDLQFQAEQIEILNAVSGKLDALAKTIRLGEKSSISGDLLLKGDSITLAGRVNSGAIEGRQVILNGRIDGALKIAAEDLTIGPNAKLLGSLTYVSPTPAHIDDRAEIKGAITRVDQSTTGEVEGVNTDWPILLFGVVAAIMAWRAPQVPGEARSAFEHAMGPALMDGAIAMAVPPIAILIFAVTIFGLPFAAVFGVLYACVLICAEVTAIATLGDWLVMAFGRPPSIPLRTRLIAIFCGTLFLWLMTQAFGLIALIFAAILGLGIMAAFAERALIPKAGL